MSILRWISSSVLILGCLLSIALFYRITHMNKDNTPLDPSITPSFMEKIDSKEYNHHGLLHRSITASKIKIYSSRHALEYEQLRLTEYKDKKQMLWQVSANQGVGDQNMTHVDLHGHVLLSLPATPTYPKTILYSNIIHFFPDEAIAKTHEKATLIQPNLIITSEGFYANLKKGKALIRLSKVQATYITQPLIEKKSQRHSPPT